MPGRRATWVGVGLRTRRVVLLAAIACTLAAWPPALALAVAPAPVPAGTFTAVSAGFSSACALRTDGTLACWGTNFEGESTPPAGTFTALSVSTGPPQACAVRADQTLACWGRPFGPLANPVSPPAGTFTDVSVGGGFGCALRTDQTLVCWPDSPQTAPPAGTFTSVSSGATGFSCGVRTDATLACWPPSPSPIPTGTFTSVSMGGDIACALRTDQSAACFLNSRPGVVGLPPGAYTSVSANSAFTVTASFQLVCALRTDATALCVGPNQLTPQVTPPGAFTAIAAGGLFACGIRPDATLACWPGDQPAGAPPVPASGAPAQSPPSAPAAQGVQGARVARLPAAFGTNGVFTLPSNRTCVSRRNFRIRVRRQRAGVTLVSAAVAVNGRRVAVRRGARLTAPVDLRGLPRGRFTVRISALTADGRAIVGTRRYRTCAPKKASGGHGPLVLSVSAAAALRGWAAGGVPVLGAAFVDSVGWGHAHPRTLSSGGTANTFYVTAIKWKNWGARQSVGLGKGLFVPAGQPISAGRLATKELVAYDLGTCHGRRAYLKLDWWFPGRSKRQHYVVDRNGNAASMCVS